MATDSCLIVTGRPTSKTGVPESGDTCHLLLVSSSWDVYYTQVRYSEMLTETRLSPEHLKLLNGIRARSMLGALKKVAAFLRGITLTSGSVVWSVAVIDSNFQTAQTEALPWGKLRPNLFGLVSFNNLPSYSTIARVVPATMFIPKRVPWNSLINGGLVVGTLTTDTQQTQQVNDDTYEDVSDEDDRDDPEETTNKKLFTLASYYKKYPHRKVAYGIC